jgi:hypothetical protein
VTSYDCLINQGWCNTYGVDWTPTAITVMYNGQPCLIDHPSTGSEPFNQPFFIALTQALGVGYQHLHRGCDGAAGDDSDRLGPRLVSGLLGEDTPPIRIGPVSGGGLPSP